jgi:hypothetical protein
MFHKKHNNFYNNQYFTKNWTVYSFKDDNQKKKDMKIGIITFWQTKDNYGQILQCYALQQFLQKLGHEPILIRYMPSIRKKNFIWFISLPIKILQIIVSPRNFLLSRKFRKLSKIREITNRIHPRGFEEFKNKYIISTPQIFTNFDLYKDSPIYDAYICGSDQIWGGDPIFFLDFVSNTKKRISYAASFNKINFSKRKVAEMKYWLSKFDLITVREKSGIELCKLMGRNDAVHVLDPTLLLNKKEYIKISATQNNSQKYIFLYLLGNDSDINLNIIYQYAENNGLLVKYIASQGRNDTYEKIYPTIEEWLSLLDKASFVITNSYHALTFSIIFNKQFLIIPLCGLFSVMNTRIISLLSMLQLECRVLSKNDLSILSQHIDYENTNNIIQKERVKITLLIQEVLTTSIIDRYKQSHNQHPPPPPPIKPEQRNSPYNALIYNMKVA